MMPNSRSRAASGLLRHLFHSTFNLASGSPSSGFQEIGRAVYLAIDSPDARSPGYHAAQLVGDLKPRRVWLMRSNRIRYFTDRTLRKRMAVHACGRAGRREAVAARSCKPRRYASFGTPKAEPLWMWPLRAAESACLWPFVAAWFLLYRKSPDPP